MQLDAIMDFSFKLKITTTKNGLILCKIFLYLKYSVLNKYYWCYLKNWKENKS